jgi:hypothetical protein
MMQSYYGIVSDIVSKRKAKNLVKIRPESSISYSPRPLIYKFMLPDESAALSSCSAPATNDFTLA